MEQSNFKAELWWQVRQNIHSQLQLPHWGVWRNIPGPYLFCYLYQQTCSIPISTWWPKNLCQHCKVDQWEDHQRLPGSSWLSVIMQNTRVPMRSLHPQRLFIPVCQRWNQSLYPQRFGLRWSPRVWPRGRWRSHTLQKRIFHQETSGAVCNQRMPEHDVFRSSKHEDNCHNVQWSHRMLW